MGKPQNRSQLMDYLGATQRNTVWSWCGVDHGGKKVYFSIWTHGQLNQGDGKRTYILQEPQWGIDSASGSVSPARKDHDEKFALVFDEGYEAFGYFIDAKDKNAVPAQIEHTKTSFIVGLDIKRLDDGRIVGSITRRIEIR